MHLTIEPATYTGGLDGTVTLVIDGRARQAPAHRLEALSGRTWVHGFVGRYKTGKRLWQARVQFDNVTGALVKVRFGIGRYRSGGPDLITWDPATYATLDR